MGNRGQKSEKRDADEPMKGSKSQLAINCQGKNEMANLGVNRGSLT